MTLPPLHPIDQPNGPGQRILGNILLTGFWILWGATRAWDHAREWHEAARIRHELHRMVRDQPRSIP